MHTILCLSSIAVLLQTVFSEGQIQFPSDGGGFSLSKSRPRPQAQSQRQRPVSQAVQSGSNGCNCLPKSECPKILGQLQYPCLLLRGGEGICCIPQKDVVVTEVGFNKNIPPSVIPTNIIDKGIEMGNKKFQTLLEEEQERLRKGQFLKRGDPARGHAFFFSREPSSKVVHDLALKIALASKEIANMLNLSPQDAFSSLPQIKLQNYENGRTANPQCLLNNVPTCDTNSKYRVIDGSCNNLRKPLLGKSETGFSRIRSQLYEDGLMTPRENSVDGQLLPNVRKISNNILTDIDLPDRITPFGVLIWAQFMEHDLTYTPDNDMEGNTIVCCENGHLVSPKPESCFPILISPEDGVNNSREERCINFVRSSFALNEDCTFGPVEQLNVVTHWLDGSMIYGSTETTKHKVADLSTGFMRTSANGLPPLIKCEAHKKGSNCFLGGVFRIKDNPGLLTMYSLWIREHNRIAAILKKLNPHWDSNQLYEETRRIVVAQIQHITYSEWLPIIIGPSLMDKFGINILKNGYRNSYDPSLDPRIKNEFSTAAFRFGHSLGWRKDFRIKRETSEQSKLNLKNTFNSPGIRQNNPDNLDSHVNALTIYYASTLEVRITQELDNHLLGTPTKGEFIIDPMSLNLQRGRDHAISTYNKMREAFGIGRARTFNDLRKTTPDELIVRIQRVYRSVDDIDLWIGGITERPVWNGVLGPTFANIVGSQFQESMNGDRYFYDMGNQAGSFTPAQLQELRKASIARIYCDNSNVKEMQPLAFEGVSQRNPRVPCNDNNIPRVNLAVFKE